jgi:glutathione synthase/RimK-type ligase-like ATP-grasp enzyme
MYHEEDGWRVGQIFPSSLQQLNEEETGLFAEQMARGAFVSVAHVSEQAKPQRIACLWDENDNFKPSWEDTLEKFERVALKQGALFETITKNDMARLPEYDALFIRTCTAIDHFSFTFAQRAESLGMPVIDDPQSIIKCSNKVYLHELFQREDIPTPKTITVSRRTKMKEIAELGFPMIVKLPQGTFSAAVKKADNEKELKAIFRVMFKDSPLLIVQEFTPTPFDWRICTLEGKILFACKYHQAKDHWQIARRFDSGFTRFGKVEAVAISKTPAAVKEIALKGADLIGKGLYGVDLKETDAGVLIIEINDNPNIETGYEDVIEKDRIYKQIIGTFLRRIQAGSKVPKPS